MRVAVLSGGRSSEHEVSLNSGASVADGLRAAGHDVIGVLLERDGRWTCDGQEIELTPREASILKLLHRHAGCPVTRQRGADGGPSPSPRRAVIDSLL